MAIQQTPFRRYHEEKKQDTFAVWLNNEERQVLNDAKQILQQPKDSTALKMLAMYGYTKIKGDTSMTYLLDTIFKNKAKNKRIGITEIE